MCIRDSGYTVTTGVWARSIIQEEYDVDLSQVTWCPSGDEHVADYQAPSNVQPLDGGDLEAAITSGDIVAAVGAKIDHPDIATMYDDPFAAGLAAFKSRGLYPINHTVVVRDDLLAENPDVAVQVFDAFTESKNRYVANLKAGSCDDAEKVHLAVMEDMDDPLPYGIEPNRDTLERLIGHAVTQQIIPEAVAIKDLFAKNLLEVTG